MLNRKLFSFGALATVGVIAIVAHIAIKPLYRLVAGSNATQGN